MGFLLHQYVMTANPTIGLKQQCDKSIESAWGEVLNFPITFPVGILAGISIGKWKFRHLKVRTRQRARAHSNVKNHYFYQLFLTSFRSSEPQNSRLQSDYWFVLFRWFPLEKFAFAAWAFWKFWSTKTLLGFRKLLFAVGILVGIPVGKRHRKVENPAPG